jgi:cellulose synthase/poly-beta-1,6-N-acetylglucosamine synthase-like glycosyltransferase
MAYNEERNIGRLLDKVFRQNLDKVFIDKVIVVASGCTDKTVEIVQEYQNMYPNLELIVQERRLGKSSAINLFLEKVSSLLVVMESADTLPGLKTIERLVCPLNDSGVGMTGCRPMPQNNPETFMGFTNHLLWEIHHLLSLERPKMGEAVAFRNIVKKIPETSAVDETSIEAYISKQGLEVRYVPEAEVQNYGAENFRDFIKQRRRIYAGHSVVKRQEKYKVATLNGLKIFWLIIKNTKLNSKTFFWLWGSILLEVYGRLLGYYDFFVKRNNHTVWEIAESTKEIKNNNDK